MSKKHVSGSEIIKKLFRYMKFVPYKCNTCTVPNSSELSSTEVPTKSKDKHFKESERASSRSTETAKKIITKTSDITLR